VGEPTRPDGQNSPSSADCWAIPQPIHHYATLHHQVHSSGIARHEYCVPALTCLFNCLFAPLLRPSCQVIHDSSNNNTFIHYRTLNLSHSTASWPILPPRLLTLCLARETPGHPCRSAHHSRKLCPKPPRQSRGPSLQTRKIYSTRCLQTLSVSLCFFHLLSIHPITLPPPASLIQLEANLLVSASGLNFRLPTLSEIWSVFGADLPSFVSCGG